MKTASSRTDNETLIRELRDDFTDAIRAKDADRVLALFADEPVMFVLSPPLRFRGDEGPGKKGMTDWFASFEGKIGYELRELEITAGDTVAFCHSLVRISGTRTSGETTDLWVRETLGLRKIGDDWKIAHQHQSVPMQMDGSGRAATDLKP